MTAQIRGVDRNCDEVPFAGADLAVAARTHVGLRGLIGLHAADLDGLNYLEGKTFPGIDVLEG